LLWSIDESLTDLVCQLEYGDEVSNAAAKVHRDLERSTVIAVYEGNLESERQPSHSGGRHHELPTSAPRGLGLGGLGAQDARVRPHASHSRSATLALRVDRRKGSATIRLESRVNESRVVLGIKLQLLVQSRGCASREMKYD
jgi:hypothetical protein